MSLYDQKADRRKQFKKKVDSRAQQKVRNAVQTKGGKTFEEVLGELGNDYFVTQNFLNNHVSRQAPSEAAALAVANRRAIPLNTLLFLEDDDVQTLADEVRGLQRQVDDVQMNQDTEDFTSENVYSFIVVKRVANAWQAGEIQTGRIVFRMRSVTTKYAEGKARLVFGIHHLTGTDDAGQDF